ncbi:hypothetical protein IQ265_10780 [Nodosilinea sp. LEGE 06152]|uniref:hypothetical protein n=1 Tax=Nodosilinea sp. LEGE 06152 TaxID=2777966 RepID=UPI00187DF83D|nr:hypothetical protein [Nodosilinea sp. LEGE 06152]MBE9157303.1 hypothetical protein [Nodosilinea sp. LEGE 06152]
MDLQSIQTKLIHRVNALGQDEASVQVDWAGGPSPVEPHSGPLGGTRPKADVATAINTLQRRAAPGGGDGNVSLPESAVLVSSYIQQLNSIAAKINQISTEQERAIAEMQLIQTNLAQVYPAVNPQGQPIEPPYLDAQRAVIAAAEVDSWGNVVLAYRTVTPNLAAPAPARSVAGHQAHQLAHQLRSSYGPSSPPLRGVWNSLVSDVEALGHEPAQLLARLGRTVWGVALDVAQRVKPRPTRHRTTQRTSGQPLGVFDQGRGASLSLVDSMLWFGGGVIGRLALNLLIGAFPALWSLAVAAITAMTAYALYRATLAPKLAFGPALRVALLVVGLIVGGQL